MKVTLNYLVAQLVRSQDQKTPLVVLPHEVTILEAIHGEDHIVVTEDQPPEGLREPHTFDTEDEYPRLQEYYKQSIAGQNAVVSVWKDQKAFDADFDGDDEPAKPAKKDAAKPAGKQPTEADLEKAELIEQAKELGIKANSNWSVERLKTDIAAKKDAQFKAALATATPAETK